MKYTTTITDPESGFNTILSAAQNFNCDRFVYAIKYKDFNQEEIEKLTAEVAFHRNLVEQEYYRLHKFSQTFNKEFVTNDNKCFDSALQLFKKLRSSISEVKLLVKKFCPRPRRDALARHYGNKLVSAFNYSYIVSDIYQLDLFKFEGYPAFVSDLYNEMERFFTIIVRSLQLCKQVLKDEENIRKDQGYCYTLYKDFRDNILKEIADFVSVINPSHPNFLEENNAVIASRSKFDSDMAWAPFGFHNGTKQQVKHLVLKQLLEQQSNSDLTKTEILLFGNDSEKVHKIRHIIKNFGEMLPENYNRGNFPAKYVQMFIQYFGVKNGLEKAAIEYFFKTYHSNPNNKLVNVSSQAVNSYKKVVKNDIDGCYSGFVNNLKSHFYNTIPMQNIG